ncbi:hypothetical protein F5X96DRAFT_615349 [Biscogniauxia mediterranea]|nr:hypothetical protein F5X96DRAFT_615349 [Biscogniauxia mediterranea]
MCNIPRTLLAAFSRGHDRSKSSSDHTAIQQVAHGTGILAVMMIPPHSSSVQQLGWWGGGLCLAERARNGRRPGLIIMDGMIQNLKRPP